MKTGGRQEFASGSQGRPSSSPPPDGSGAGDGLRANGLVNNGG
jgi:hypothetical protein